MFSSLIYFIKKLKNLTKNKYVNDRYNVGIGDDINGHSFTFGSLNKIIFFEIRLEIKQDIGLKNTYVIYLFLVV